MERIKILLIALCTILLIDLNYAQVSVIANKNISVKSIDLNTLKNIYELNATEIAGKKVKLFNNDSDNTISDKFYSFFGRSYLEIKKIWLKAKLTGNANPPTSISSDDEMISKVSSTPDAIGFVRSSSVNGNVKVILEIK
ncbi:MAG: hypothetical protein Q8M94_12315 [Ignavibacteria bacterium]|nr:hypothetical protein [Ignavibacteria bacterium]